MFNNSGLEIQDSLLLKSLCTAYVGYRNNADWKTHIFALLLTLSVLTSYSNPCYSTLCTEQLRTVSVN